MITNIHQRNPAPFSLSISKEELTILQGRKQHKGLIASAKVSKIYEHLEKVTSTFAKAGMIETPTKTNLSRCANYLKIYHYHLSIGDIQPMFYLSSKGSITKIKVVDIANIETLAGEYWLIAKELILKMNDLKKI